MTARIRLNQKKGIFFLILFTVLLVYSFLADDNILSDNVVTLIDDLQAQADTNLISIPSNYTDSFSLYSRMRIVRTMLWLSI
jgi:hypothetical protein